MEFNFSKKKITIILLFTLIILAAASIYYYFFSKYTNYYNEEINKITEYSALSKQQIKEANEIKEKTVNKIVDKIKGFHYVPPTESTCKEKNGEEAIKCLDSLKSNEAFAEKNSKKCLEINDKEIKYHCLKKIVRETRDVKICKMIDEESFERSCFNAIAFMEDKPELCKDKNKFEENECLGPILAFKGALSGDIEECKKINILEYSNLCMERLFNNFNRDCRFLKEKTDQAYCENIVTYENAMEFSNIKLCDLITDNTRKKVCVNILEKGDSVDSDSDGLKDGKELWFNTDPFSMDSDKDGIYDGDEMLKYHTNPIVIDTDGDNFNDGDEVKGGYNPNGDGKLNE